MSDLRTLALIVLLLVLLVVVLRPLHATSRPHAGSPRLTAAVGVAAVGAVWFLVNEEVEGPVLFVVAPEHGLTTADLPSALLFVAAIAIAWPRRGRGGRSADP